MTDGNPQDKPDKREKTLTQTKTTSATGQFIIDNENSGPIEVPTITRLLNRRKSGSEAPEPPVSKNQNVPAPTAKTAPAQSPPKTTASPGTKEPARHLTSSPAGSAALAKAKSAPKPAAPQSPPQEIELSPELSGAFEIEVAGVVSPVEIRSSNNPTPPSVAEPERKPTHSIQTPIKASRRSNERRTPKRIILWEAQTLASSTDGLAKGLRELSRKPGFLSALFMNIVHPEDKTLLPHFISTAAVGAKHRLDVWTGLLWDPKVVPELWNPFVRAGSIEFPPPGPETQITSHRNVIRAAFGVRGQEWLTLVRAGPAHACRGVIAIISQNMIRKNIDDVVALIQMPSQTKAA